jgi:hypothetical protein
MENHRVMKFWNIVCGRTRSRRNRSRRNRGSWLRLWLRLRRNRNWILVVGLVILLEFIIKVLSLSEREPLQVKSKLLYINLLIPVFVNSAEPFLRSVQSNFHFCFSEWRKEYNHRFLLRNVRVFWVSLLKDI